MATPCSAWFIACQPPTSFKSEIYHRRKAEHDHEKLQHLGVNGRGQAAFQNVNQHDAGADEQGEVIIPAQQLVEQLGQRVHGNAGGKHGHDGEADGIQSHHRFIEPHLQIFRHGPRLGAVIKRHHKHGEKDHRRNRADPIEVRGGDAIFRAAGGHADQFQRAEIGGNEGQSGHPRWNRARGREKIRRTFHVTGQRPADADDKADIGQQNGVINPV